MRRFIAIGVGIFLVFLLLIVLIVNRGTKPEQDSSVRREDSLVDYANTDTDVRFTKIGRINARENHRVFQVTVGRSQRTITVFEGYEGRVLKRETYLNDEDAYRTFLAALQNSGYTRAQEGARNVDPLGACPAGQRYRYDIIDGSETKQSLWSTSCGNLKGTFAGRASTVRNLFEDQVPNYNAFIKGVQF